MMIGHCPDAMLPAQTGDHSYFSYLHVDFSYLHVDDVAALYTEFVQRGAIVRQPPTALGNARDGRRDARRPSDDDRAEDLTPPAYGA